MNHVNGFDTTGADLKLVELFAARQLCSSTQRRTGGGTKRRQRSKKQQDGCDDDDDDGGDLEHTRSTVEAIRAAAAVVRRHTLSRRTVVPNVKNPPKNKFTQGDFTRFSMQVSEIFRNFRFWLAALHI